MRASSKPGAEDTALHQLRRHDSSKSHPRVSPIVMGFPPSLVMTDHPASSSSRAVADTDLTPLAPLSALVSPSAEAAFSGEGGWGRGGGGGGGGGGFSPPAFPLATLPPPPARALPPEGPAIAGGGGSRG